MSSLLDQIGNFDITLFQYNDHHEQPNEKAGEECSKGY